MSITMQHIYLCQKASERDCVDIQKARKGCKPVPAEFKMKPERMRVTNIPTSAHCVQRR